MPDQLPGSRVYFSVKHNFVLLFLFFRHIYYTIKSIKKQKHLSLVLKFLIFLFFYLNNFNLKYFSRLIPVLVILKLACQFSTPRLADFLAANTILELLVDDLGGINGLAS